MIHLRKKSLEVKIVVWSIFSIISLAGLAITPVLPEIQKHFKGIMETQIDMLVSLPNLIIVPCVLLSGYFSKKKNKINIIRIGLLILVSSAILYQFSNSYLQLLLISLAVGVGIGIITPLANSLPAQFFNGKKLRQQLGFCSGIASASQVLCSFLSGVLLVFGWHASFLVYAIAIIPFILTLLFKIKPHIHSEKDVKESRRRHKYPDNIIIKDIGKLMILYFFMEFLGFQIPLSLPFLLAKHGHSPDFASAMIALFFFVQSVSSGFINYSLRIFDRYTIVAGMIFMMLSLFIIPIFIKIKILIIIGVIIGGLTEGIIQPLIWDKTTKVSPPHKHTQAFGYVMSASYFTLFITPFILRLFSVIFHDSTYRFPFYISGFISLLFIIFLIIKKRDFIFGISSEYL